MTFEAYPLSIEGTDVYDLSRSVEREILRKKLNSVASKSNAWIDPVVDFGMDAAAADNSTALNNAIDEAHSASNIDVGVVCVPPGSYKFTGVIDWKNCHIIAAFPNNSVRFIWDGAAGATFMSKTDAAFGELAGINFRLGDNAPAVWLDLTGATVDKFLHLHHLHFFLPTTAAIDVSSWINAHWEHLRWDGIAGSDAGWAMRFTPTVGQSLSSFVLDGFTYDHSAPTPADGMIRVDNSANASNLGVFRIANGRIEVNTAWGNDQAIVSYKIPNSGVSPRALGLHLSDVTYQDSGSMANDCVLFRDTTDTNSSETVKLTNFRSGNLSEILGGTMSSNTPRPPGGHYLDLNIGFTNYMSMFHRVGLAVAPAATTPGSVTNKLEVFGEDGNSLGFVPIYDAIT